MMNPHHARLLVGLFALLLAACPADADTWQDGRYHLSMEAPNDWAPMSDALLAETNAQVSHLTGRGFIAGYALTDSDVLMFPYMLVQFKPYSALPAEYRPAAKLGEHDHLKLLYALVGAFRQKGPLPADIDTPQFIDRFGNKHARLVRLEADGRFDFTGQIPHEQGDTPIRYHTHGIPGRDGIALVTVFAMDDFGGLAYVIQNEMRTIGFEAGFGADALPDEPPALEPATEEPVAQAVAQADEPTPATTVQQPAPAEPATTPTQTPAPSSAAEEADQANAPAPNPSDSTALVLILSLLGVALIVTVGVVWYMTHQKAVAERERRRARKERMLAAQQSTSAQSKPRPAAPPKAGSRGSSGRRTAGKTR